MRLGAEADRIHRAGAEVIAISTDDEARQAGMFARWPTPHVRYVSDPGGDTFLQALQLYDAEERGGIGLPGLLVIDPDGEVAYRYVGRDFADRTTDDEMFTALERLNLDPVEPPEGGPVGDVPADLGGYFAPTSLVPYFRGNRFAAIAIGGRLPDPEGQAVAREHRLMCDATLAAWERLTT